jgi:hypothetical protein
MTIPSGGDDRTIRSSSGGPGDPTVPARPGPRGAGAGDPTIPADRGGTGGVPPTGGGEGTGDEPPDRRLGLLLGGIALAGVLLGALVALLVGSGGGSSHAVATTSTSSSTTTTTSSSTTTSSTTTTTAPVGPPQVLEFSANQTNPPCTPSTNIQVTWATQNAQNVTLAVDGGTVGGFGPTGSHLVAFSCPPASHTYKVTANGANGQTASRTVVVTTVIPPTTTSSTTTTTTTTSGRRGPPGG